MDKQLQMTREEYAGISKDYKSEDPKDPRVLKYVPGKGTVSMPVKFVMEGACNNG